jgi:hypothetical protein
LHDQFVEKKNKIRIGYFYRAYTERDSKIGFGRAGILVF